MKITRMHNFENVYTKTIEGYNRHLPSPTFKSQP